MPLGDTVTRLDIWTERNELRKYIDDVIRSHGFDSRSRDITAFRLAAPDVFRNDAYGRAAIARALDPQLGVVTSTMEGKLFATRLASPVLWPHTIVRYHRPHLLPIVNRISLDREGMHLWNDTLFDTHVLATIQGAAITTSSTERDYKQRCWELAQFTGTNFDWRRLVGRATFEVEQHLDSWQLTRHLALVEAH